MPQCDLETWDLWFPNAAAAGISFARGRLNPADRLWVHAAPESLRVEVLDGDGRRRAFGDQPARTSPSSLPMTLLTLRDGAVDRLDRWPTDADIGDAVILPGGEVGIIRSWWNDEAGREWRWTVEFYNRRR